MRFLFIDRKGFRAAIDVTLEETSTGYVAPEFWNVRTIPRKLPQPTGGPIAVDQAIEVTRFRFVPAKRQTSTVDGNYEEVEN